MARSNALDGRKILIVEDEFLISEEMVNAFESFGGFVIGPVATVAQARELIAKTPTIDAAVVDINLRGQMSFEVAHMLVARDIPFVFATGYDSEVIPSELASVIRCEKPVEPESVAKALFGD